MFLEPWHAEAFSLVVALNRQGAVSWSEWTELFAATLRDIPAESGESVEAAYYRRWLLALEKLVARKGLASVAEIAQRKEEWRDAYLHTPHGRPVELKRSVDAAGLHRHHDHSHATRPVPIAVSPARPRDAIIAPA
ncbi:MAG: nitrile hydratase accessory protein [Xanthobacteraceae bacterium]